MIKKILSFMIILSLFVGIIINISSEKVTTPHNTLKYGSYSFKLDLINDGVAFTSLKGKFNLQTGEEMIEYHSSNNPNKDHKNVIYKSLNAKSIRPVAPAYLLGPFYPIFLLSNFSFISFITSYSDILVKDKGAYQIRKVSLEKFAKLDPSLSPTMLSALREDSHFKIDSSNKGVKFSFYLRNPSHVDAILEFKKLL